MRVLILLLGLGTLSFALSPGEEAKVKVFAREYIKDHLKAPATAIFSKETVCAPQGKPDLEEAKGTGPTPECKPQKAAKVGGNADSVVYRASVDSQNSYGALLRTKFQIVVDVVNGKWSAYDMATSVKDLKQACEAQNEFLRTTGAAGRAAMEKAGHSGKLEDCAAQYPNAVGGK